MSYRIDLPSIDRSSFRLLPQAGGVLVQPLRTKLAWRDEELPLRSLLTDPEGRVRSAGWPKFFNYGEHEAHDEQFRQAVARGDLEFSEKLDGTLIIADGHGDGVALRTRGQASLGEFDAPVRALLEGRYPRLAGLLAGGGVFADHSLLFEYVAPEHTIVVRYEQPALYFLGAVCKKTLAPRWDAGLCQLIEREAGVPPAPLLAVPPGLGEALDHIRAMSGKEGVVARFRGVDGRPLLIKIKAAEYLRIHGRRATLGERGVLRLAYLLDLRSEPGVAAAFASVGLDHEAATYALGTLRPFFAARQAAELAFERLRGSVAAAASLPRRDRIEQARAAVGADPAMADPSWFAVAIKLIDDRERDARLIVDSALIGEPVPTLRTWQRNREAALAALTAAAPAPDDT